MGSKLFSALKLRDVELKNRIVVSPMCQYSCVEGVPTDWHLVHLGSRAVGGAGLVITEATAVSPEGRISPNDTGLWNDHQCDAFRRIAAFVAQQNSVPGIQLAHAGRKASTASPWKRGGPVNVGDGGWTTVAPSSIPFADGYPVPSELRLNEMEGIVRQFADATHRAKEAGFKVVEVHCAHGYLLHEFLSPLTNTRNDEFGGDLHGRMNFPLRVIGAVRNVWPESLPLLVRISVTDWVEGGWDLEQSIVFARHLRDLGVDLVDCSSGGLVPYARVPAAPGYHVPFASAIRNKAGVATGVVGLITDAPQAEDIIAREEADAVLLARAMLRDPYWPLHAAKELEVDIHWPVQYERAKH